MDGMGLRDWAKHRGMKQPVPGAFVVQDSYSVGTSLMLTGVLSGQGVAPHAAEVKIGLHDRWLHAASNELPALIDAVSPSNFTILWDDVAQVTQQQRARMVAERAAAAANGEPVQPTGLADLGGPVMARLNGQLGVMFGQPAGRRPGVVTSTSTSVTVNGVPVDAASSAQVSDLLASLGGLMGGGGASVSGVIPEASLRQGAGQPAEAVVLAAHDVPEAQWPAGPRPPAGYVDFALDVTGPDGATWSATALQGFLTPERRAAASIVGSRLPIRFDPANRTTVAIDLGRLEPAAPVGPAAITLEKQSPLD